MYTSNLYRDTLAQLTLEVKLSEIDTTVKWVVLVDLPTAAKSDQEIALSKT
jgi:hypothetical protein